MTQKYRFKADKLVRDKIPSILQDQGIELTQRVMEPDEYLKRLKNKLVEEAQEVLEAQTSADILEELADVSEVFIALAKVLNFSQEQIEQKRLDKKEIKGGFETKVYIDYIDIAQNHPRVEYYRKQPHKYPHIK